jgi:predicted secreted protein
MYCKKCGSQNDDNAWKCIRCGEVLQQGGGASGPPPQIANHLVEAILVTLFCCVPFGIPAIVYAAQVNSKMRAGDIQGAIAASNNARTWVWVSVGAGLLVGIIYVLLMALGESV